MSMKKHLVCVLVLVLFLPGCWSRIEINDIAIISLVAIDRAEDDLFHLYLQIVLPTRIPRPSTGGGQGGTRSINVISSKGRTVMDAARQLQLRTPRRLFWSHANVILLGEDLARSGLSSVEDFLTRFSDLRLNSQMLVVRGDLRRLLKTTPGLERMPAETIRELGRDQTALIVSAREYMRDRAAQGKDAILPVLALVTVEEGGILEMTNPFYMAGAALFRGDRVVAWAGERETRVLMWLLEQRSRGVITADLPDKAGQASVEMTSSEAQRRVVWQNRKPQVQLRIALDTELVDVTSPLRIDEIENLSKLETAFATEVSGWVKRLLDQMRQESIDPLGLGQLIRRSNHRVWRQLRPRWRTEIQKLPITYQVRVTIEQAGLSKQTRTFPAEELPE